MHNFSNLKFCCELEFTRTTSAKVAVILSEFFGTECIPLGENTYEVHDNSDRTWYLPKGDSTKLLSPLMGYEEITILQHLATKLLESGPTSFSCSVRADFDAKHLRYLCNLIYDHQALLIKALKTKHTPIPAKVIETLNKHKSRNLQDFALIWFNGEDDASNRLLNLTSILTGGREIKFQLFNGVLNPDDIKSFIQLSLLLTLKALKENRQTRKPLSNDIYDKETMLNFLLAFGVVPGDEFIDMRIRLCQDLPPKKIMDCDCDYEGTGLEAEPSYKPPQITFPNFKEVPASTFAPVNTEEWERYCQGID